MTLSRQQLTEYARILTRESQPHLSYGFAVAGMALTQNLTPVWSSADREFSDANFSRPLFLESFEQSQNWGAPKPKYEPGE